MAQALTPCLAPQIRILGSADQVAIDALAAYMMGPRPHEHQVHGAGP